MVEPDEGNYHIAQQGRRGVRHVLDQVLSGPSDTVLPSASDSAMDCDFRETGFIRSGLLDGIDIDDRGPFLDWLDGTADSHEPWVAWMNFN